MKILCVIFLFIFSLPANADFNYSSYKSVTFEYAESALEKDSSVNYIVETNGAKYKVSVKYAGKLRTITEQSKELISYWVGSLKLPTEIKEQLAYEVQIEVKGNKYWLPIQKQLVEPFTNEVKENAMVNIYIVAIGTIKSVPVFGISEFEVI